MGVVFFLLVPEECHDWGSGLVPGPIRVGQYFGLWKKVFASGDSGDVSLTHQGRCQPIRERLYDGQWEACFPPHARGVSLPEGVRRVPTRQSVFSLRFNPVLDAGGGGGDSGGGFWPTAE